MVYITAFFEIATVVFYARFDASLIVTIVFLMLLKKEMSSFLSLVGFASKHHKGWLSV
ncbi:hypothetical protein [Aliiglaciecola lipolytica]|uniref:hypothetical protein n=1 Tax=Aliiglaciecola lipolytica TaxID=477689 RepID=UPI001C09F203|nr:hypothetical protein [Aliiglaciecola lipolytica]MBU2877083.1 hypothetical protein [Aliiglaciecola lipolytica]